MLVSPREATAVSACMRLEPRPEQQERERACFVLHAAWSAAYIGDAHREALGLRGRPLLRAQHAEVRGLQQRVHVLQEDQLALVQLLRRGRCRVRIQDPSAGWTVRMRMQGAAWALPCQNQRPLS
jgi:hypothetical protein